MHMHVYPRKYMYNTHLITAPLGSLLLRPSLVKVLQRFFYLLALVQFVSFAYLKVCLNPS